jgi:hypothetical protein
MVPTRKEGRMLYYRLANPEPTLQHRLHQLVALSPASQRLEVEER